MAVRCKVCQRGLAHVRFEERVEIVGLGWAHPECADGRLPKRKRGASEKSDGQGGGMRDRREALRKGSLVRR